MSAFESKVLLVEDDPIVQRVHRMMLNRLGYEVFLAETAGEALMKSQQDQYGIILMDMGLPDGEGVEVTKEIRRLECEQNKKTPIVVLTAYVQDEVRDKCLEAGADDVHTKPITLEKLDELLRKWIK